MTPNIHQQARELIACTGAEELSSERRNWLRSHLEECASCREYAEATAQMARALRSIPFAADSSLVRTTQERVRVRARQLQQEKARMHFVWMSCALVAVAATLTTPFLWQGFRWLGETVEVSAPVWQIGFAIFWMAPSLGVSVFLIARGIHLDDRNNTLTEKTGK